MTPSLSQPDLFGEAQPSLEELLPSGFDRPPPDFVARIRGELEATLGTVRRAEALPWPDLTKATLAELRFHSIAGWLPEEEAGALRAAFETEMARLYERRTGGREGRSEPGREVSRIYSYKAVRLRHS